jgi:hypothetical protein
MEIRVGNALETLRDGVGGPVDLTLLAGAFGLYRRLPFKAGRHRADGFPGHGRKGEISAGAEIFHRRRVWSARL